MRSHCPLDRLLQLSSMLPTMLHATEIAASVLGEPRKSVTQLPEMVVAVESRVILSSLNESVD
jgi:hypothetical protein